ncbi:DUF4843 domain-containing protein [Pedobacter nyackensis]|uniref:DUF4843 domain-containing protein n=1 Tax=Pedobacter nyackensis TaxID=475255 RepID=UPI00292FCB1B|nr:DUF4843 domain-containing protein [Pedobacter nyackensis]
MKLIKYFIMALVILTTGACKKEEIKQYSGKQMIDFGSAVVGSLVDSTQNFTFYYSQTSATQDTAWFDIYALGGPVAKDRKISLRQVATTGSGVINALPGVDYKEFSDPDLSKWYVMKAGAVKTRIPIVMLRTEKLETTNLTLMFDVVANGDFEVGVSGYLWRKLIFTEQLSKPFNWPSFLGTYSVEKHKFIIANSDLRWDSADIALILAAYSNAYYYNALFVQALNEYNNTHEEPLRDENKDLITFPIY